MGRGARAGHQLNLRHAEAMHRARRLHVELQVLQQLAVVGLGDLSFSRDLQPALTTVRIDGARIGSTAARFIVERSQEREVHDSIIDIGFSIIERDSA